MFNKLIAVSLRLTLLFVVVLVQGQDQVQRGPPDYCIKGVYHLLDHYHKDAPTPEENNFPECTSWQNSSCCTYELANDLSQLATHQGVYNFTYDLCGSLSPECAQYFKNADCFYYCEPILGHFQVGMTAAIQGVPVCADYCDAWFEACKDDRTCVEHWLDDFVFDEGFTNRCPSDPNASCRTFREEYGDGEGLCNQVWGNSIFYSTNSDNCTVMAFDNNMANPNFKLTFPQSGSMSVVKLGSTMIPLLMFIVTAATI